MTKNMPGAVNKQITKSLLIFFTERNAHERVFYLTRTSTLADLGKIQTGIQKPRGIADASEYRHSWIGSL